MFGVEGGIEVSHDQHGVFLNADGSQRIIRYLCPFGAGSRVGLRGWAHVGGNDFHMLI